MSFDCCDISNTINEYVHITEVGIFAYMDDIAESIFFVKIGLEETNITRIPSCTSSVTDWPLLPFRTSLARGAPKSFARFLPWVGECLGQSFSYNTGHFCYPFG